MPLPAALALTPPPASGPPVGSRIAPYSALIATGPDRGRLACYVCAQGDKPGVIVFVRSLSPAAGRLLAALDTRTPVGNPAGRAVWLTYLCDPADLDEAAKWAAGHGVTTAPIGVVEDADGPPAYRLGRTADITVVAFAGRRVTTAAGYKAGGLTADRLAAVVAVVTK